MKQFCRPQLPAKIFGKSFLANNREICLENPQFDKQFENMEKVIVYSDGKPTELSNLVNIKTDGKS